MKQGRITDRRSEEHERATPVCDAPYSVGGACNDRRAIDQLLNTLVQGLARRVATHIIKNGDTT
jgi:hypothetical protein